MCFFFVVVVKNGVEDIVIIDDGLYSINVCVYFVLLVLFMIFKINENILFCFGI